MLKHSISSHRNKVYCLCSICVQDSAGFWWWWWWWWWWWSLPSGRRM